MKARRLVVCVLIPLFAAAQDLPPGVLLVSKIKAHIKEQMSHMPRYTCLETFERAHKPAGPKGKLTAQDTVRLEVLFSGQKEFFDSPGGRDFKESDPSKFVGSGVMGNGMFAGLVQSLFVNDQGLFTYRGEEPPGERRTARFDFMVPILQSGYVLSTSAGSAEVAWKGTFWADPVSFDLMRLEVHADDIPAQLETIDATTTVEYARTRIGLEDVPLPQTGELSVLRVSGEESVARFEFTHCRSFQTETSISFADSDAPPDSARPVPAPPSHAAPPVAGTLLLPAGLMVKITLDAPVTERAAVGELLEGHVASDVMARGKTVIPAGATVHGRIRRMEHYTDSGGYFTLGFEFTDIEGPGIATRFLATLESAAPLPGFELSMSTGSMQTSKINGDRISQIEHRTIRAAALPGVGIFFMRGAHFLIPKGWNMVWKTQALK